MRLIPVMIHFEIDQTWINRRAISHLFRWWRAPPGGCLANYLDNWKSVAVLKGDGSSSGGAAGRDKTHIMTGSYGSPSNTTNEASTARYFRLSNIAHADQVVWHWAARRGTEPHGVALSRALLQAEQHRTRRRGRVALSRAAWHWATRYFRLSNIAHADQVVWHWAARRGTEPRATSGWATSHTPTRSCGTEPHGVALSRAAWHWAARRGTEPHATSGWATSHTPTRSCGTEPRGVALSRALLQAE